MKARFDFFGFEMELEIEEPKLEYKIPIFTDNTYLGLKTLNYEHRGAMDGDVVLYRLNECQKKRILEVL